MLVIPGRRLGQIKVCLSGIYYLGMVPVAVCCSLVANRFCNHESNNSCEFAKLPKDPRLDGPADLIKAPRMGYNNKKTTRLQLLTRWPSSLLQAPKDSIERHPPCRCDYICWRIICHLVYNHQYDPSTPVITAHLPNCIHRVSVCSNRFIGCSSCNNKSVACRRPHRSQVLLPQLTITPAQTCPLHTIQRIIWPTTVIL